MIADNLRQVKKLISQAAEKAGRNPAEIQLVAVSKRFSAEAICEAYAAGQRCFGENYVQELRDKRNMVPAEVRFHFIGHLQTNKAKLAAESCDMVESVDRLKLAKALHQQLLENGRQLDILIQVNVGDDPKKSGVGSSGTADLLRQIKQFDTLRVRGLMTMPPLVEDPEESRPCFRQLRQLAEQLQKLGLLPENKIELSMGMSSDFHIAIDEGATIVRVGTAIFGERQQKTKGKN